MSVDIATLGIKVDATDVKAAKRELDNLAGAGTRLDGVVKNLMAAFAGTAIGMAAVEAVKLADVYSNMQGRLGLVTKGTDELAIVTERLFGVAQRTRQGLEATTDLYASLGRSTKSLGASQTELLQITETISQALIVSGANAASSEAALRQLGQGFASGALRGDELNSIMENTPRLAQAIAEGMGVTIGQLREFGKEGKLTGTAIFDALLSQKAVIEEEFAKMPVTVGQAFTQLNNSILSFVGEANKSLGVTRALADSIKFIADNVDKALPILGALAAIITAALAPAIARMTLALTATTVGFIANTVAAISNAAAMVALSATISIQGTAVAALSSAWAGLRAASMAFLGLGIVGVIGGIAAAFIYLNNAILSTEEATSLVKASNRDYISTLQTAIDYQKKYGLSVDGTSAAMDASLGITAQTNNMADAASRAALQRAAAERQLTVDILRRRAAEMQENAERLNRSAFWERQRATVNRIDAKVQTRLGLNADDQFGVATEQSRRAASQSRAEAEQITGARLLTSVADGMMAGPVTVGTQRVATSNPTGDKPERGSRTSAISEEARELQRATEAANDYTSSLKDETAQIGMNNVQRRMAAVEAAALEAPTAALAEGIRNAGQAWKDANQAAATADFVKSLQAANDATEFETSLQGMNAKEREVANAQRAISIALAEAEANGTPISTEAIAAQTRAILANAAARGDAILNVDNANEYADAMGRVADRIGDAADGMRGLFGTAGDALADITSQYFDYAATVEDINARIAEAELQHGANSIEANRERASSAEELAQTQVNAYGAMLSSAKGFFEEGTTGYKVMQAAEQAYRLYQFAMAVKSMFFETAQTTTKAANVGARMGLDAAETTSSVAKSGIRAAADGVAAFAKTLASLPFPFNLAAGAVVLAALVGVGVAIKGGMGGGSKGATSSAMPVDEKPTSYTPFVSHDRGSSTYTGSANDNRIAPPSQGPLDRFVNGQKAGGNVFDFSNANFSGSDPEAVKAAVQQGIQQARPELLDDARRQTAEDLQQLNRQQLGG